MCPESPGRPKEIEDIDFQISSQWSSSMHLRDSTSSSHLRSLSLHTTRETINAESTVVRESLRLGLILLYRSWGRELTVNTKAVGSFDIDQENLFASWDRVMGHTA
jgi:hypothetical protein